MSKKNKSVMDIVDKFSEDQKFKDGMKQELKSRSLAKFLFVLRCDHDMTQSQLAKKMNCTQSHISKLESSYDDQITVKDLMDYGRALGLQLELGYRKKSTKIVDQIKYHAFKIKSYLEELTRLAEGDEAMKEGVKAMHAETFFNMVKIILESYKKMPAVTYVKSETIHISKPLDMSEGACTEPQDDTSLV